MTKYELNEIIHEVWDTIDIADTNVLFEGSPTNRVIYDENENGTKGFRKGAMHVTWEQEGVIIIYLHGELRQLPDSRRIIVNEETFRTDVSLATRALLDELDTDYPESVK